MKRNIFFFWGGGGCLFDQWWHKTSRPIISTEKKLIGRYSCKFRLRRLIFSYFIFSMCSDSFPTFFQKRIHIEINFINIFRIKRTFINYFGSIIHRCLPPTEINHAMMIWHPFDLPLIYKVPQFTGNVPACGVTIRFSRLKSQIEIQHWRNFIPKFKQNGKGKYW